MTSCAASIGNRRRDIELPSTMLAAQISITSSPTTTRLPDFWTPWSAKDIGGSTSTHLLILLISLLLLTATGGVVRSVANEMHQASYREHVREPVQVDTQWNG